MTLKGFEADGFRTHSFLFGFMYPLPAKWNVNFTKMFYTKSYLIWIPYIVVCSILCINGMIALYYAFRNMFWFVSPNFAIFNTITLLMAGSISVSFIIVILFTANDLKNILCFVNFVLSVTSQILKGKFLKHSKLFVQTLK